jgi:hypothetical protein
MLSSVSPGAMHQWQGFAALLAAHVFNRALVESAALAAVMALVARVHGHLGDDYLASRAYHKIAQAQIYSHATS